MKYIKTHLIWSKSQTTPSLPWSRSQPQRSCPWRAHRRSALDTSCTLTAWRHVECCLTGFRTDASSESDLTCQRSVITSQYSIGTAQTGGIPHVSPCNLHLMPHCHWLIWNGISMYQLLQCWEKSCSFSRILRMPHQRLWKWAVEERHLHLVKLDLGHPST